VFVPSSVAFILRHQPVLKCRNLRVDHAVEIQLATPSKGDMFRCVRQRFWMPRVFECCQQDEQRRRGLVTGPADQLRQCLDLFFA
jgi:hypothetical protein